MTREVATSREIATRESADRSDGLYIKQNDWMVQTMIEKSAYIEIPNMGTLFNFLPITISYKINSFFYTPGTVFAIYNADHSSRVYCANDLICSYNPVLSPSQQINLIFPAAAKRQTVYIDSVISLTGGKAYVNGQWYADAVWTGAAAATTINANRSLIINDYPGILVKNRQYMSCFEIWHKELSAVEILEKYNNYKSGKILLGTEDGLVCYFPMQEGAGATITDTVGGKTGTLSVAEWRQYGGLRELVT